MHGGGGEKVGGRDRNRPTAETTMTQRQRLMLNRQEAPQTASRASWRNSQTGVNQSDRYASDGSWGMQAV